LPTISPKIAVEVNKDPLLDSDFFLLFVFHTTNEWPLGDFNTISCLENVLREEGKERVVCVCVCVCVGACLLAYMLLTVCVEREKERPNQREKGQERSKICVCAHERGILACVSTALVHMPV
jgi:hypothetical protein